jgi:UPF0716 protein FxsA
VPILLLLAFIVVPLVELFVIIQVGQAIGVIPTLVLLLLDSVLGAALMRSQGRLAWRRFNAAIAEGRVPAREVLDGVLVIFGGAFLLTPGFVTDVFGVLFLLPPTRAIIRRLLARGALGRLRLVVAAPGAAARFGGMGGRRPGQGPAGGARGPRRRGAGTDYDVEGTASEIRDPKELPSDR